MQKIICRKEESMNIKIAVIDNDRNYLNRLFAVLKQYSELTIFILKKQKCMKHKIYAEEVLPYKWKDNIFLEICKGQ